MKGLPGFRDFYPEPVPSPDSWSLDLRRHIFGTWRGTAERYGFRGLALHASALRLEVGARAVSAAARLPPDWRRAFGEHLVPVDASEHGGDESDAFSWEEAGDDSVL